jgi:hypothetical protein
MVLWLGISLIVVSELVDYGPLRVLIEVAQGHTPKDLSLGKDELGVEVGLIVVLYLLALASDNSGSVAVLIVVALWAAWLVRHAQDVTSFLAPAANAAPQQNKQTKGN